MATPAAAPAAAAAVVAPRKPPIITWMLGKPAVSLPFSQLTLGRSTPPWHGSSWKTSVSEVVGEALRVYFPRGSGAFSGNGPPGGIDFKAFPRALPAVDATLRYKVRFASGFAWSKGGKLPGLFVGDRGKASGGQRSATAASVRLMWLRDGLVVAYVYTPSGSKQSRQYDAVRRRKGEFGDEVFGAARMFFRVHGWNDVVLRVKLNGFDDDGSPLPNGTLSLGVNGRATSVDGVMWRRVPEARIHHIAVTSFYGGTWKCPRDTHLDLKDFGIIT